MNGNIHDFGKEGKNTKRIKKEGYLLDVPRIENLIQEDIDNLYLDLAKMKGDLGCIKQII